MKTSRAIVSLSLLAWVLLAQPALAARDQRLPDLGGAGGGLVSPAQERKLGMSWLRMFRSQVPTSTDPFVEAYLEGLLQKLSMQADLDHRQLELVVVKTPSLNAFAVPGGVVGVHTGIFLFAETEHQLSAILAHELAHLSQRHYARNLERQKNAAIPNMAALLAGLVVAATAGGEAGMAAISAVQAGAIDQRLRFSRHLEREADRIGMNIMTDAGLDPYAMSDMFDVMLRATRFSRRPPEFLLSHPVTEKRVADARQRAARYPRQPMQEDVMFHLIKARVHLMHEKDPHRAVRFFRDAMQGGRLAQESARYGLTMALTRINELDQARETLSPLLEENPDNPAYVVAAADIEVAAGNHSEALNILNRALRRKPTNHPLNVRMAELLMTAGQYGRGESLLQAHAARRPRNPYLWYLLAETHGLAGQILDVHKARAEYFILMGIFDKAEIQLKNALALVNEEDLQTEARLTQRLKEVRKMREESEL